MGKLKIYVKNMLIYTKNIVVWKKMDYSPHIYETERRKKHG